MQTFDTFPTADGFRMPAEFERHARCWMLWPSRPDVWREDGRPAQQAFAAVARAIAWFEPVTMGVMAAQMAEARALLPAAVQLVEIDYDDAWVRDTGPTFVVNGTGELCGVDWGFNAWGGLYTPWDKDEQVAARILALAGAGRYAADFVLEGGSIHVDGEGTLLTTAQCLLHPNRNPTLSQSDLGENLRRYLGVEHIIWLQEGVIADETDGHVDNLCCFARPGEVVLTWTNDHSDPQYAVSCAAYEALRTARDARGRPLAVHKLPGPRPQFSTAAEAAGLASSSGAQGRPAGSRLAASYVNFYMPNGGVIVPQFGDEAADTAALATLQSIFPERTVVGVPSREVLLGGGNIHCITQQQPVAVVTG